MGVAFHFWIEFFFSAGLVPDPHNPSNPKSKSGPEYAKIQSLSQPNTPKSSHVHPIPSLYSYLPTNSGPTNRAIAQSDTPNPSTTTTIVPFTLIPQHILCRILRCATYSVPRFRAHPIHVSVHFPTSGEGRYFHLHTTRYSPLFHIVTDTIIHLLIHSLIHIFICLFH